MIEGVYRLSMSDISAPTNLGNAEETTVLALAEMIQALVRSTSPIVHTTRPEDDPQVRCPDLTLARTRLGWQPDTTLSHGLKRTIDWLRAEWGDQPPAIDAASVAYRAR
jgi:dTDP-glucose 4,6-dehydratase